MSKLLATKPLDQLLTEARSEGSHSLVRALGPYNLISLGIGAIIGAIAGGGSGAAIGAVIGGGAGTAGVMTQRGKDIRLEPGQSMKIRTSADTNVQ